MVIQTYSKRLINRANTFLSLYAKAVNYISKIYFSTSKNGADR